ncbi:hypothetical protein RDI58_019730 [Solanum bulbocastanum]|uniref:Uncharacterized protein n=1 Tax=Solanum bulbocastanum TaxID=147425 RepID=A0AAN8T5T4_SOLBU
MSSTSVQDPDMYLSI